MARKLKLIGSICGLVALVLAAASCNGFFVDPTLTAVSVGPQKLSIGLNERWQMTATGTYDDGSQRTLTSDVLWSSSDSSVASVGRTSGKVTGVTAGSATISATSGSCSACSGSTTVTVVLQGVTSILITPSSQTVQIAGTPVFFTALADGSRDVSNGATWTVRDSNETDQTSNFTVAFVEGEGEGFLPNNQVTPGPYTVRATYNSVVGTATLNVR